MTKKKFFLAMLMVGALFLWGCGKTISDLPVSLSPTSATVQTGQTTQFSVIVDGSPYTADLTWAVNGVTGGNATTGTISASGLYTAPNSAPNPNTVTISANGQGVRKDNTHISISVSEQVTIVGSSGSPPSANIGVNPAMINVGQSATLTWSSSNVTSCTINNTSTINGVSVGTSGSVNVSPSATTTYEIDCTGANGNATSKAMLTIGATSTVGVSISPTTGTMESGGTLQFSATLTNDISGAGVTWKTSLGLDPVKIDPTTASFTAPYVTQNTNVIITATSVADPTAFATATITVTPSTVTSNPPQAGISPDFVIIKPGDKQMFVASITGQGVTSQAFTFELRPSVGEAAHGTITQTGPNSVMYQSPNVTSLVTDQIVSRSVQFPNAVAYATIESGP